MARHWQAWLTAWAVGVVVFGLLLYGLGSPATSGPAASIFALFGNPLPTEPDRFLRFAVSLMGAVTAGWGLTLGIAFGAISRLPALDQARVWRWLTLGTLAWYMIDSLASWTNGFGANVVSNTVVLGLYLVPVLASEVLEQAKHDV